MDGTAFSAKSRHDRSHSVDWNAACTTVGGSIRLCRNAFQLCDRCFNGSRAAGAFQPRASCRRAWASTAAIATPRCEKSAFAGMPPTHTCMTCHSQLFTNAAMLAPVRQSLRRAQADPLEPGPPAARLRLFRSFRPCRQRRRLLDLPRRGADHAADAAGGAAHHGLVPQLPPRSQALSCGRSDQIFNMSWTAAEGPARARRRKLLVQYHIDTEHLTDCSRCHR